MRGPLPPFVAALVILASLAVSVVRRPADVKIVARGRSSPEPVLTALPVPVVVRPPVSSIAKPQPVAPAAAAVESEASWPALPPGPSNVRREDYTGPETCRQCHEEKYQLWSRHSHSRMNRNADDESVRGDFSGTRVSFALGDVVFSR